MQTTVEHLEDGMARLVVTVPADDVDRAIKQVYQRLSEEMKIPGFRKGKVPSKVIANFVGEETVLAEAQENIVNEMYPVAMDAEGIRPVDQPKLGELELPASGSDFTFEATVLVRPTPSLSSYEGIKVSAPVQEATDEEIEAQIEHLRDRFAELEVVEDGAVSENDYALMSFDGDIEGEKFEGSTIERFLYEFGKGQMPDEFEEQLMGAVADETREVHFTIPPTSSREEFVGKEARFTVEVHEVKRKVMPELDDEFAENAGYDSYDELVEGTRKQISVQKGMARARGIEAEARRLLAANLEGDIPEIMIERRAGDIIRDFFNSLEAQGIKPEQYTYQRGITYEDLEMEFETEARESVRGELALEALFNALEFDVTDADIEAEIVEIAGEAMDVADVRDRFEKSGMMAMLREQVMHRKAAEWLMENIEIIDESPGGESDDTDAGEAGAAEEGE